MLPRCRWLLFWLPASCSGAPTAAAPLELKAVRKDAHSRAVTSIDFSPDGKAIVSVSGDKVINVWDAASLELKVRKEDAHLRNINSVQYSPDGSRILSGCNAGAIKIWDAATLQLLASNETAHERIIGSVRFSPDGTKIVSSSALDKHIRLWDAATLELKADHVLKYGAIKVFGTGFSPDSTKVVAGIDKALKVFDTETLALLMSTEDAHSDVVLSVAFNHDGSKIVSGSRDKTIRLWDAANPRPFNPEEWEGVAHQGKYATAWRNTVTREFRSDPRNNGASLESLVSNNDAHSDDVSVVAFSHDGSLVVSSSFDFSIRVWEADTLTLKASVEETHEHGHSSWVTALAVSPSESEIVSGSKDHSIKLWDISWLKDEL